MTDRNIPAHCPKCGTGLTAIGHDERNKVYVLQCPDCEDKFRGGQWKKAPSRRKTGLTGRPSSRR
jgi:ribosomal protein L37AE/L43A